MPKTFFRVNNIFLENAYKISVIISTYNSEEWLEKVLWGYEIQTEKNFELILADDGSKQPTFDLIKKMQKEASYPIVHVWQEDEGFQKSRILNKSLVVAKSDYVLMSDGDCIPRADFIEIHLKHKEKGYFLSGGYFMLPMEISKAITKADIFSQNCFKLDWLRERGLKASFKNQKLISEGLLQDFLNKTTPTNASWNGHNASGWKEDILNVNGFDERMQYGGQDRELGERLMNAGVKSKQIRYSAICIHLDHPRGYKNEASIIKNKGIREETRKLKKTWTEFGVVKKKPKSKSLEHGVKLSAVIITFNEAIHINQLLENLNFVDEIIVVDSYSTDGTYEKLLQHDNVKVFQKKFESFPSQKNFALSKASHDWVLFIDADERIKEKGKEEILNLIQDTDKVAFWARFDYYFGDKRIRFSGYQSTKTIRLFNKTKCHYDNSTLVHEILIFNGKTDFLKHKVTHYSFRDYNHYKSKILHYSKLKALNHHNKNKSMGFLLMIVKVIYRFVNHYFIRLGILDGKVGLQISYLNAYGIFHRYKVLKDLRR